MIYSGFVYLFVCSADIPEIRDTVFYIGYFNNITHTVAVKTCVICYVYSVKLADFNLIEKYGFLALISNRFEFNICIMVILAKGTKGA